MTTQDMYGGEDGGESKDSTDRIGTVIDKRYRITGLLGRGGMGSVYRAEHVTIRREVAVKLLHPSLSGIREIGRRFEREAFAAGRVEHPNCVTAADFGELDDGTLFLVMELLDGESLGDVIDEQKRLEPRRALHIARHVLRGLACAHEAGVVHRDIKPNNIVLVERDGDTSFARILDFGIAKLVGEAEVEAGGEKLTQAGVAFGTPLYLSPEQALGKPVDPRADIYSLSAVLHEMLTGVPPFDAEDKLQVLAMHATAPVPPFANSAPDLAVPSGVEELVRRGLGKTPDDRFASADEYIAAIDALLDSDWAEAAAALPIAPRVAPPTPMPTRVGQPTPAPPTGTRLLTPVPGVAQTQAPIRRSLLDRLPPISRAGLIAIVVTSILVLLLVVSAVVGRDYESGDQVSSAKRDKMLEKYTRELTKGKRCKNRKKAVAKLRALGDKRAIPALQQAIKRKSGGLVGTGLGAKSINTCLRDEAREAINYLDNL